MKPTKNIFDKPAFANKFHQSSIRYKYAVQIQTLRAEAGLTQTQLGDLMSVPQSSIARWENGGTNITVETLAKIAKAMNKELMIDFQ
ncbi:helix-turn-helix transcriptional regulator [Lactobacillus sp. LC28-10]|uniref:Helix-turn-helix transcriptional regulator n=1 Tax=Secundilactobacillus angelensis TaxID=2722706 RepID=A0ABX1KVM5_9LACO|nr:helix-turn-helix transcriptional regulator [Secundilactobacillus angelensis]MCH5461662.1 helix-turn-helix transcriptional regulator [Secundilactobacillus angelensis]NLR17957.1 helix-turn-helix transcriptional regulator [Secundilactobacillus angelensis]